MMCFHDPENPHPLVQREECPRDVEVTILASTVLAHPAPAGGGRQVYPGETVMVSAPVAADLIARGLAEAAA
tara:strand:+ start:507 stop:722 length:216 start_codon:yes stop_codon:yes gene_type:complete